MTRIEPLLVNGAERKRGIMTQHYTGGGGKQEGDGGEGLGPHCWLAGGRGGWGNARSDLVLMARFCTCNVQ